MAEVTDNVMGGVSQGQLTTDTMKNRACVRLQGDVRLDNNGGFVQAVLDFSSASLENIEQFTGLKFEVYGNNEDYNIHLRTKDLTMPWQAYRATFNAPAEWTTLEIPFTEFKPYRTRKQLNTKKLKRIGLVAIGREFQADLCLGKIGLYR